MRERLGFRAAAGVDRGRVHEVNQDSTLILSRSAAADEAAGLYVVADGMGGHQAGDVASELAVKTMERELGWLLRPPGEADTAPTQPTAKADLSNDPGLRLERWVVRAIERANQVIYEYARNNPLKAGNLGTTLTCALLQERRAVIANVGDSRSYLLRNGVLRQLTEDHSYVARLVREGQIRPEEVYTHPRRNVITRSLGHRWEIEVDSWLLELEAGDRFLLCSDGVWEMIQDEETLVALLRDNDDPEETVEALITAANERGGQDNIGVVVIQVEPRPADR
jgi:protein phosphatase